MFIIFHVFVFFSGIFKKALEKASSSRLTTIRYKRLGSPETTLVALTCNLYETALATLTQMKLDILTGNAVLIFVICISIDDLNISIKMILK